MLNSATQTRAGARSIFGGIIVSSILGTEDRADIEELAKKLFLDRSLRLSPGDSRKLARVPAVKSAVVRAAKLSVRKHAIMDRLAKCVSTLSYLEGQLPWDFYTDFPWRLRQLDPEMYGPWTFQPLNCCGGAMGGEGDAWYFRRDPHEIEDAFAPDGSIVENRRAEDRSARVFLARYGRRLRRILAEAIPGRGGL
jgi:hypothetical protein